MPSMPRPKGKATAIAQNILGIKKSKKKRVEKTSKMPIVDSSFLPDR